MSGLGDAMPEPSISIVTDKDGVEGVLRIQIGRPWAQERT
jgi:hypothetical protein